MRYALRRNAAGIRLLRNLFVMGGGGVAKDELQYADSIGLPWLYIPSRARNEAAYKSTFGPVHEWVKARLDQGPHCGTNAFITVAGHQ